MKDQQAAGNRDQIVDKCAEARGLQDAAALEGELQHDESRPGANREDRDELPTVTFDRTLGGEVPDTEHDAGGAPEEGRRSQMKERTDGEERGNDTAGPDHDQQRRGVRRRTRRPMGGQRESEEDKAGDGDDGPPALPGRQRGAESMHDDGEDPDPSGRHGLDEGKGRQGEGGDVNPPADPTRGIPQHPLAVADQEADRVQRMAQGEHIHGIGRAMLNEKTDVDRSSGDEGEDESESQAHQITCLNPVRISLTTPALLEADENNAMSSATSPHSG